MHQCFVSAAHLLPLPPLPPPPPPHPQHTPTRNSRNNNLLSITAMLKDLHCRDLLTVIAPHFIILTLRLLITTIVAREGSANSKASGLSNLLYTTCNHSEQVFSYRSEPTFIQTRHFSLDSQVLDFTPTKIDREYQISSCH